jgi:signal transduction histidine kinase
MAEPGRDAGAPLPEWLSRLAHDLRNPITPMRSAVQLLQLGQLPPELAPDLLRTLDRQIDFLLRLIDDVADLVKIERGTFALNVGASDLGAMVSAAVARHARRGGSKAAAPVVVDAPPEPLRVRADEVRMRQLLETLLGCLSESGDAALPASVQLLRADGQAVVRIADGGRPLGPNTCLEFLASGELPQDVAALSMSYLVARRLVELHGATVALVDGGRALELRLPLADAA